MIYFIAFWIIMRNIFVFIIVQFVNPVPEFSLHSLWGLLVIYSSMLISDFLKQGIETRTKKWELKQNQKEAYTELTIGQLSDLLIGVAILVISILLSPTNFPR